MMKALIFGCVLMDCALGVLFVNFFRSPIKDNHLERAVGRAGRLEPIDRDPRFAMASGECCMSDRAKTYRKRAGECMERAKVAKDLDQKKQYLDMADGWLKLARHAERWEKKSESRD
jgi:hypothetical protein